MHRRPCCPTAASSSPAARRASLVYAPPPNFGCPSRPLDRLGVALGGVADEAGLGLAEPELDLAGGAVAVLGQAQVDDLAVLVVALGGLLLLAPQEQDQVRVLLDGAGPVSYTHLTLPTILRV